MRDGFEGGIVMPPPPGSPRPVPMAPLADDEVAYVGPPPPLPAPDPAHGDGLDDHAFFGSAPSVDEAAGAADIDAGRDAPAPRVTLPRVLSVLVVATLAGAVGWLATQSPKDAPAPAAVTMTPPPLPEAVAPPATPAPAVQALAVAPSDAPPVAVPAGAGTPCVAQSSRERCVPGLPRVAPSWTPGDGLLLVVSDLAASVRIDGIDVGAADGFVPVRLPEGTYAVEVVSVGQVARMDARVQAGALNRARFRFAR